MGPGANLCSRDFQTMVHRKAEPASPALLPGKLFSGSQWNLSIHGEKSQESVRGEKRERCCPRPEQCSARSMPPLVFFWQLLTLPYSPVSRCLCRQHVLGEVAARVKINLALF